MSSFDLVRCQSYPSSSSSFSSSPYDLGLCQDIVIPVCMEGIPYNSTIMPNVLGHQTQEEAAGEAGQFYPFVLLQCSPDLRLFVCSVYTPVCNVVGEPIPPCRPLCESARNGCSDMMSYYGFPWPDAFSCEQFPQAGLCFGL
ncbi:frizzled-7-like [Diadema setosum]|uniref:frizzled-7-like n=1 Tax=Diadema setosum TaxID=31175 RepID=UPI003B3AAA25